MCLVGIIMLILVLKSEFGAFFGENISRTDVHSNNKDCPFN